MKNAKDLGFVTGHGFTGCGKTLSFEGYGLQPVRKQLKTCPALAAEAHFHPRRAAFRPECAEKHPSAAKAAIIPRHLRTG
jgi:hypothetical protein